MLKDCSEADSDMMMKTEAVDIEMSGDDYKYLDDISRENSRDDNSGFYENAESDETEDETGEINKSKMSIADAEKLTGKFIC